MNENSNLIRRIAESESLSQPTKDFLTEIFSDYLSEKETEDLLSKYAEAEDAD